MAHSKCPFCRLLISALIESNPDKPRMKQLLRDSINCALEWIKDGRTLEERAAHSPSTRRLRVFATDNSISDAYLILLAPEHSNELFLGRRVSSMSVDLERVRSWLLNCETSHGTQCQALDSAKAKRVLQHPAFRVIDVNLGCLVQDIHEPYLALSYVWGPALVAEAPDTSALSQPGALTSEFSSWVPLTIRDALQLTKLLGYKYLWVDWYCIDQRSVEGKAAMIAVMDVIYTAASLTICAANGDSHFGIPGILRNDRKFAQTIETYDKDVQLMVSQPAERYIKRSKWNTRAWTFQERLCSNKCLIFVDGRVFFQCRQSLMCEDIHMEDTSSDKFIHQWSLELKDVPGHLFSENPLRQYTKSVQLYTERRLSFNNDKLPAFSAIQTLLSVNLNTDFRVGLPTSYFDFALLWTPRTPLERIPQYPSWSWCGWDHAIEYRYETLEGTLVNLHEWLKTHTWITWCTKTSHGDIELAWNGEQGGLAGRWKGYERSPQSDLYGHISTEGSWPSEPKHRQVQSSVKELVSEGWPEPFWETANDLKLQFWTHSAFFKLDPTTGASRKSTHINPGLHWCSLSDAEGDWCGTVLLDKAWTAQATQPAYEFIAISEARDFSAEEHDSWNFYVPKDRVDSQWDLYYVLLIDTYNTGVSERVGLGKVFKDAFKKSLQPGYEWKEIVLG